MKERTRFRIHVVAYLM